MDHIVGKTSFTMPTTYVALYTVTPSDSGGGTEVSGGSYARVATSGASWAAASGGANATAADLTFPTASGSWGTVVAIGILDASSSGNLLWWGPLAANKTIDSGDSFKIPSGSLTLAVN